MNIKETALAKRKPDCLDPAYNKWVSFSFVPIINNM